MKKIAENHGFEMVLLFGSVAVDKTHNSSDIDIAIKISQGTFNFKELSDIYYELQRVFSGQEVDLAIINYADPLFLKKILESPILLFGSEHQLDELKIYTYKRYVDHRRYFQMEKNYVDKFLDEHKRKPA